MPPNNTGVCYQFANSGTCTYGERCKFKHVREDNSNGASGKGKSKKTRSRKGRRVESHNPASTHIDEFFETYSDFDYDASEPVMAQFWALCDYKGWERNDLERDEAFEGIKDALSKQFNDIYGTDVDNIAHWQNLCRVLSIYPIPGDLEACRNAVDNTYVNLVDLVELKRLDKELTLFPSEVALSEYTLASSKIFPRDSAYAGGLLRYLLRYIS